LQLATIESALTLGTAEYDLQKIVLLESNYLSIEKHPELSKIEIS